MFYASEHALVVTPKPNIDIDWLTFSLKRMRLNQHSESSAQPGLSAAKLLMDAEIEALEARRAKTRDLKQAMMQELLTGRIRLV
jgi:type I restriction enzyme S subunit